MRRVFGYGSLAHRRSLEKGLGRPVRDGDLAPALLRGWRRVWGATSEVVVEGRPGVTLARFLDLVPDGRAATNGVAIEVTDAEFERFLVREKGYALLDVTGCVDAPGPCVAFASAPGTVHRGDVVLAEYVRLVEEAFDALGPGQLAALRATTAPPSHPVVAGLYRFVDPEQNARTSRDGVVIAG